MTRRRGDAVKWQGAAIIVVMLLFAVSGSSAAQELWYAAYDSALKAIASGDWATAEAKLATVKKSGPAPARRVKAYGTNYIIMYVPDYYLGVVYFNQGRYQEAADQFARIRASGVLKQGDKEFAEMEKLAAQAGERLRPQVAETKPAPPPPTPTGPSPEELRVRQLQQEAQDLVRQAGTLISQGRLDEAKRALDQARGKDPSNRQIADLSAQITQKEAELRAMAEADKKQAEFQTLLRQAEQALSARNYGQAKTLANQAGAANLDPQRVGNLLRSIDVAENVENLRKAAERSSWVEAQRLSQAIEKLDPRNADLARFRAAIEQGLATQGVDELEKSALVAFYSGNYEQSASLLDRVAAQKKDSGRVYFYMGCANAALALMQGKQGDALMQKARQQFAQARRLNPSYQYDTKYISPKILRAFADAR
ncbi:MAG: hypothetical protein AB1714_26230 [Acidobacteriota bacterium]